MTQGSGKNRTAAAQAKSLVVLRGTSTKPVRDVVRECMERCRWREWVPRDATVVVKPNLCTAVPEKVGMSNTAPEIAAAVCEVIAERAGRIVVGESDGLRESADAAIRVSGYRELGRELGVEVLNFSRQARIGVECGPAGKVELPRILVEADVFITLPVLKTHALTWFTGALKNQWGCLPQHDRILYHRWLDPMLVALERQLRPAFALMDGIVGMEGRGPTNGKPRRMDVILASQDPVALDAAAMRLVGLDPRRARHVLMAADAGLGRFEEDEIELDGEWADHAARFEPAVLDGAVRAMNYMSRYGWFVKYALEQDRIFYPVRSLVHRLRRLGVVEGGA
ncbi:MAG: DUF362 domain-containing protein [Acidobacteriota bacterium]|nr:DUF362 domain-containing protein [Acidobacteriota bacterium]